MLVASTLLQSGFFHGGALFAAFEQLDRMPGHDGRNRVFVYELGMSVPPQQHAEIIEPGHHPLQLHSVHEEYREWDFGFAYVIEESVLKILCAIGCHGRFFRFLLRSPRCDQPSRFPSGPMMTAR
jgi:hypothetical protein